VHSRNHAAKEEASKENEQMQHFKIPKHKIEEKNKPLTLKVDTAQSQKKKTKQKRITNKNSCTNLVSQL
jgi:hypothetical protein